MSSIHKANRPPRRPHHRQRGAVLLVMLVIVVMGAATVLVGSLSTTRMQTARQETTAAALAQAKEALIVYSITYGDTHASQVHGYLPCPDIDASNGEGSSKLSCGNQNVSSIGRLPWKTLGLSTLRDGDGECLWYAVSGTYQSNQKTDLMNWDTRGLFEVLDASGAPVAQDVVAVVFAPSSALVNQNRAPDGTAPICGGNYAAANYLDSDGTLNNGTVSTSANVISQFRLTSSPQINDRLIYITRQDIWNAMLKRNDFMTTLSTMTKKTAECIADYGRRNNAGITDKRLPWSGRPVPAIGTDCSYRDSSTSSTPPRVMYGRLPNRVSGSRSLTSNQITQSSCSGTSSYYQLKSDGSNCPNVPDWSSYQPWWSNWKDHVFYTLAYSYRPEASTPTSCGTCLSVNGSGQYAAIVIFAGKKLSIQARSTDADRSNFANYLEGNNLVSNTPISTSGNGDYQSNAETSNFNDVLYCINPNDLTVSPC